MIKFIPFHVKTQLGDANMTCLAIWGFCFSVLVREKQKLSRLPTLQSGKERFQTGFLVLSF